MSPLDENGVLGCAEADTHVVITLDLIAIVFRSLRESGRLGESRCRHSVVAGM